VEVADNGPGLRGDPAAALESGVGLRNTRDRLAQLYGGEQSFGISNRDGGGVRVRIEIPARAVGGEGE
jgi:signal transduction histidine kinase